MTEKGEIRKEDVEECLGCNITDGQFHEALEYAKRKQAYIYSREKRGETLERWYLVMLTEESVRALFFSKFTMDLCRELRNMEKEHLTHLCKGAPEATHIVTSPAL